MLNFNNIENVHEENLQGTIDFKLLVKSSEEN